MKIPRNYGGFRLQIFGIGRNIVFIFLYPLFSDFRKSKNAKIKFRKFPIDKNTILCYTKITEGGNPESGFLKIRK